MKTENVVYSVREFIQPRIGRAVAFDTSNWGADESRLNSLFAEGKLLFYEQSLGEVVAFSKNVTDTELAFGVLPLPKWDIDQLEYHTPFRDVASAISIPKNVQSLEMAGCVTEALCMYSYMYVRPEYLETAFGRQYQNDASVRQMLDIIRESFTVDFAHAYTGVIGNPYSIMDGVIRNTSSSFLVSWISNYESRRTKLQELYTLMSAY